jgi:hypothetical protein
MLIGIELIMNALYKYIISENPCQSVAKRKKNPQPKNQGLMQNRPLRFHNVYTRALVMRLEPVEKLDSQILLDWVGFYKQLNVFLI